MKTALAMVAVLLCAAACAHDAPINNLDASIHKLDEDVRKVVASAKNPDSANDPTTFRARVHEQVLPLRERLEKLRDRTNTNSRAARDENNQKDATAKEDDKRAKMEAELDQMEQELNSVDTPESGTPP